MNRATALGYLVLALAAPVLAQDAEDERIARALEGPASFHFLESPLGRALESIQEEHGIPIVLDPGAGQPNVSLTIEGVSLDESLRGLLEGLGLAHVVEDGVLLVTRRDALERRRLEVRSYGVLDLVERTDDHPGPRIGIAALESYEGGSMGAIFAEDTGLEAFSIEDLEEYIRSTVEPASWDREGRSISIVGASLLVVSQIPEVHARIEEVLEEMRAVGERQVEVEGRYYALARSDLAGVVGDPAARTVFLDAAARQRLADRGRLLDQLTIRCDNTQRASASSTRLVAHIRDYDVTIAQSSVVFDPIVGLLSEGMTLDVRPVLSPGGQRVAVDVRTQLVRFAGAPRDVPVTAGEAKGSEASGKDGTASGVGVVVGRGGWLQAVDGRDYHLETMIRIPPGRGAAFVESSPLVGEGEVLVFLLVPGGA